jgi:hypothetical protein
MYRPKESKGKVQPQDFAWEYYMEVIGQLQVFSTHCIGGWVDPKAGLDTMKKTSYPSRE